MQETYETRVPSLGWEDPLEEGLATHSSVLAWRIPWTEEPGGLRSMGSQSQTGLKRLAHEGGVEGLSALYPTVGGTPPALGRPPSWAPLPSGPRELR